MQRRLGEITRRSEEVTRGGVSLTAAATEGKSAAEVAESLRNATGAGNDAEVVINKRSTLGLSLPSGTDPSSHLSAVQSSVCAGKPAGCSVSIDSGAGRRMQEALAAGGRRLQSTQITFVVEVPVGAADSLSAKGFRAVIETNLVKRDNMTRLVQADVVSLTQLPGPTDLIFSRQMMQHMCNSDVRRVLDLISRSGARFALLTHFETDMANSDIHCNSGGYRPQDLLKPPFSLPPPIRYWCAHRPSAHLVRTLYVR